MHLQTEKGGGGGGGDPGGRLRSGAAAMQGLVTEG